MSSQVGLNDLGGFTPPTSTAPLPACKELYFERVNYSIAPVQGGVDLVCHLVERKTQVPFRHSIQHDLKSAGC
jgi:hypothetical protein